MFVRCGEGRRNKLCLCVVGKGDAINCVFTLWGQNESHLCVGGEGDAINCVSIILWERNGFLWGQNESHLYVVGKGDGMNCICTFCG